MSSVNIARKYFAEKLNVALALITGSRAFLQLIGSCTFWILFRAQRARACRNYITNVHADV